MFNLKDDKLIDYAEHYELSKELIENFFSCPKIINISAESGVDNFMQMAFDALDSLDHYDKITADLWIKFCVNQACEREAYFKTIELRDLLAKKYNLSIEDSQSAILNAIEQVDYDTFCDENEFKAEYKNLDIDCNEGDIPF